MITREHVAQADAMLTASDGERSAPYRHGYVYALSWALAGRPAPTPERNKDKDNPHPRGSAERDAWLFGWGNGLRHAQRIGLISTDKENAE